MPGVFKQAAAVRDLVNHYVYLAGSAGGNVADRFLQRAEETFFELSEQPGIGAPLALRGPGLAGLRKWRVTEFEDVLIFYLPRPDGVSISRVLHAAQDWWRRLGLT